MYSIKIFNYSDIANKNGWRNERVVGHDKSTRNTGQKHPQFCRPGLLFRQYH